MTPIPEQPPYQRIMSDLEERRRVLVAQLESTDRVLGLMRDNRDMTGIFEVLERANVRVSVVPLGY